MSGTPAVKAPMEPTILYQTQFLMIFSRITKLFAILVATGTSATTCGAENAASMGFGQPTGGNGGATVTVTDANQLSKALRSPDPLNIQVEGSFDSPPIHGFSRTRRSRASAPNRS